MKRGRASKARILIANAILAGVIARAVATAPSATPPPPGAIPWPGTPTNQADPRSGPRVEIAGCQSVTSAPDGRGPTTCEVPRDGALRVWIDAPEAARITLRSSDDAPAIERPLPRGQGRLFTLTVRPNSPWIAIDTILEGAPHHTTRSLSLAHAPDEIDAIAAARRTDPERAERDAKALLRDPDPTKRARATGLLARIHHARGDLEGARDLFERAIHRDAEAGRVSDLYADTFALAYTLGVQLGRAAEARDALRTLARLREVDLASPEHEAQTPYYEAVIAHEAGDLRAALSAYRTSRERAARLGDDRHRADVLSQEARILLDLGRGEEGASLYEEAAPLAKNLPPCAQATFYNNWSSFLIELREATEQARRVPLSEPALDVRSPDEPVILGGGRLLRTAPRAASSYAALEIDPAPPLERAIPLVERACPDDRLRGFIALNLAQVRLLEGDLDAARDAALTAQKTLSITDKHDEAELLDVRLRVALARGERDVAWDLATRLHDLAEAAALPTPLRRAAIARAELLAIRGDASSAEPAYEEAERLAMNDSLFAPLGEGRIGFLERLSQGPRAHVTLLLSSPRGAALAAKIARRSIAHMLASLGAATRIENLQGDERRAWESKLAEYRRERARIEDEAANDWRLAEDARARAATTRRLREERARADLERAPSTASHEGLAAPSLASSSHEGLAAPSLASSSRGALPDRTLASPREGELFLVYFPLADATWAGFAIEPGATTARVLGDIPEPATEALLADRLLAPFREQIQRARAIRFFAPRALRDVDLHALPFEGRLLIERAPITYGLDLRNEGALEPLLPDPKSITISRETKAITISRETKAITLTSAPAIPEALVVADPSGGLREARNEGDSVRRALLARGLVVTSLGADTDPRAALDPVRARLERTGTLLFHLAGHARLDGKDGWESAIPLASGGALTVGDVLALAHAPRLVVLSGCETGRSDGLGLAHAFVVAGAEAAVGTSREVPDASAARVMALFYAHLHTDVPPAESAALALQAVARESLHPRSSRFQAPSITKDWKSFRVLVP